MIMMLPFFTALLAIFFGMRGQRTVAITAWAVTFVIYLGWLKYHMTDQLNLSF
jgi:uncharacterized membrane protein